MIDIFRSMVIFFLGWKLCYKIFGWNFVILEQISNDMPIKHAYILGIKMYANPYSENTRTELLPGGKVFGQCYVKGWRPLTPKTLELFNNRSGIAGE